MDWSDESVPLPLEIMYTRRKGINALPFTTVTEDFFEDFRAYILHSIEIVLVVSHFCLESACPIPTTISDASR